MGLFTNTEKTAMDEANEEYVQSVRDIAETEQQMAEDIDYTKTAEEAYQEASEIAKKEAEMNAAKQQELNRLEPSSSRMGSAITSTEAANQVDITNKRFQEYQTKKQNQREERNKQIIAAKQLASEEAKMKYELAAQRYSQAKTNWTNAAKVLQTLGCAAQLIPGWGTAINVGLQAAAVGIQALA